jgi:hypothetical protein
MKLWNKTWRLRQGKILVLKAIEKSVNIKHGRSVFEILVLTNVKFVDILKFLVFTKLDL